MSNELIVVRQLPIIEDQLRTVRDSIMARVEVVLNMECTEETYKEVKKARSELNAQYRELEQRRKEVKAQVEAPYRKFEEVYKTYAGDIFLSADKELARKIAAVEESLKQKKREQVEAYFNEYRMSRDIPFNLVSYEQAQIAITMSASLKSLKAQAKTFLDRIADDLALIATQEHKDEILVEYYRTLNASAAVLAVNNRHAAIERQRQLRKDQEAALAAKKAAEETVIQTVTAETAAEPVAEPVAPPAVVAAPVAIPAPEEEKIYPCAFYVNATIPKLKALKKFLEDGGYDYGDIPDYDHRKAT